MYRKELYHSVFLFLLCIQAIVSAETQDTFPAHFGTAEQDLLEKLDIPQIAKGTQLISRCAGWVSDEGIFVRVFCFTDQSLTQNEQFAVQLSQSIPDAAASTQITPAMVNGSNKSVWFNFSVVIDSSGSDQEVMVLNNHLYNEATLGRDYISAQRYDRRNWGCYGFTGNVSFGIYVSSDSEASDFQSIQKTLTKNCERRILRALRRSKYIPAFLDGSPIDSHYIEFFFGVSN